METLLFVDQLWDRPVMLQAELLSTAAVEGSVHVIETLLLYGAGVNDNCGGTVRPVCR